MNKLTVKKEIDEEGKEILSMETSYKDLETKKAKPVNPQIPLFEEEPAVTVKGTSTKDIEDTVEKFPEDSKEKPNTLDPKDVVYDKSGAVKYDGTKPRMDLIPSEVVFAMGDLFRHGAAKYAPRNWEKGMAWGRMYGSLQRHLVAWWGGEDTDPESGKSHLHHASACLAMLIAYEARSIGEDDRNKC